MQHESLCSRLRVHVVSTQSCFTSWPSCLLQCRTYPFSRETAVNLLMGRGRKSAFVGQSIWLSCARKQVHMFACLFVRICWHATNSNQITCRGSKKLSLHFILRGLQLSILGGEVCDDWSCASQRHCAGSIAPKHACARTRIYAISGFRVTFSCTLLIMQLFRFSTLSAATYATCEAAPVNYVVPNALQPSTHADGFTLMRFVALFVSVQFFGLFQDTNPIHIHQCVQW